jgi:hypothetical protein
MEPRTYLRLEGLAVLAVALGGYLELSGPLWLLAVLALAPDLSMAGYLAGPQVGALAYNTVHTYVLPLALGAAGLWADVPTAVLVALVWAGHVGADRLFGYGLKYSTGFRETHLSTQPAPHGALSGSEDTGAGPPRP